MEDMRFDQTTGPGLVIGTTAYERCTWEGCDLRHANWQRISFTECTFIRCDLSLCSLDRAAFKQVRFAGCKLMGTRFDQLHAFLLELDFERCVLDLASFHGLVLKGTRFEDCRAREADFSGADLSGSSFRVTDLAGAVFDGTNLEGADLSSAVNYTIHPDRNRLKKARFSESGLAGLLAHAGIIIEPG
jgi:fluoroquinolone resistance protein